MKHLLLFFCCFFSVVNAETMPISQEHGYAKASPFMSFVHDQNNSQSIKTLSTAPWQKMHSSFLNSFTREASWTTLSIQNTSHNPKRLIFKNPNASMSEIDVYLLKNNEFVRHIELGTQHDISLREIPHRYSVFSITLEADETLTLFTRLANTVGAVEGEWEIYSHQSFADFSMAESMWWGIFIGVLSMAFLYIRPFLLIIKNKALIFSFTFFVVSCLGYQLSINGIFYTLGISEYYIDSLIVFFGSMFRLATVFILYHLIFINYEKSFLRKALIFFISFLSLVFILSFFTLLEKRLVSTIAQISVFSGLLSYLIWFLMAKDIFRLARSKTFVYVLAAYTIILVPNAYQSLVSIGVFESSFFSIYGVSIASLFNIYLLALAVLAYIEKIEKVREDQEKINEIQMHYASIGKIIGNIAHQWKVPLVRSGSLLTHAEALIALKDQNVIDEMHTNILPELRNNLIFMKETIDTFYTLYKVDHEKKCFCPEDVLSGIWSMLSAKAVSLNIKLHSTIEPHLSITSYEHHFGHLMMILLDNAIDAARERKCTHAIIFVTVGQTNNQLNICVEDTCGGITQKPLESSFELEVSSKKSEMEQRGRGLYIFKTLLESKFCGSVTLCNTPSGAKFDIAIPYNCEGGGILASGS